MVDYLRFAAQVGDCIIAKKARSAKRVPVMLLTGKRLFPA